ncbi:unnamed protein product [Tenebrio molitor]|nr:unnamed protein product [Tenebrio molitor]
MVKRKLARSSKTKKSSRKSKRRSRRRSSSSSSSTSAASSSTTTTVTSSSTSSSSTTAKKLRRQLKDLKGEVNRLKSTRSTAAHPGDECLIPIFDPARDDARIEHWVERVDSLAERYRWDDDTIIRMIASRLKGNARQWYDEQTRSDATWAHIRNDFVAQFPSAIKQTHSALNTTHDKGIDTIPTEASWPTSLSH